MSSNSHVHKPDVAPICAKCSVQMWLVRTQSLDPPYDLRTFACPKCDAVLTEVVKAGSKRSGLRGRLGSKTHPGLY